MPRFLAAQPDATVQAADADEVIDNSGTFSDLRSQIIAAWARTVGKVLREHEDAQLNEETA